MPRRENPLGPAEDGLTRFAADLRALREDAGTPTYRQLSARAHYSAAALSEAAGGRKLPSLPVTLAYVRACDGDPAVWEQRWRELAAAQHEEPAAAVAQPDEVAPYAGFAPIEDPALFAGRADLVAELTALVRARRLTAVVGASGSGTTSLLRAGLVPALTEHVVMTPGPRPLEECAVRLADVVGVPPGELYRELAEAPENLHLRVRQAYAQLRGDLVLVVDRFEEAIDDEHFVAALVHAATAPTSRLRVVLGVRADAAARLPDAVRDARVHVGALTADGLREAITEPAAAAGCRVETALLVRLIADTGGPGTLPFLQQALLEVWRRRRGTTLTLAAYEAVGGIPRLIGNAAERVFTALDADGQRLARRLVPRLAATSPAGDGVRREDLDAAGIAVLDEFVRARVVVADRDHLTLAGRAPHEYWPRLRDWLAEDGDRLRAHRELAEAATTWETLDRDPGALYRGVRLESTRAWLAGDPVITARERDFLLASEAARTGERRRVRRLRAGLALLSVLVVLATGALAYAVRADLTADRQRNAAIAQSALREAAQLLDTNPALAAQLTVAAHRLDPTAASRNAVLTLFANPYAARITGHDGTVHAVAVNGDVLATAGDDTTRLWDVSDPNRPRALSDLHTAATSVTFSGDGRIAVTGHPQGALLWDVTEPAGPRRITLVGNDAPGRSQSTVALSEDGTRLALSREDEVRLYDVTVGDRPRRLRMLSGHTAPVTAVSFSRDGTTIATAGEDRTVRLWPVAGGAPTVLTGPGTEVTRGAPAVLTGDKAPVATPVLAAEFSPDGRFVATAGEDGSVRMWRVADGAQVASLQVHGGPVRAVAFSQDGELLTAAGDDRATVVWDVTDLSRPRELATLGGHTDVVTAVRFTPDGRNLITSSRDRTVRLVNIAEAVTGRVPGGALAWGRDGTVLASGGAGTVLLSDARDRHAPRARVTLPGTSASFAGALLATGGRLWDVGDPARPREVADVGDARSGVLSRDGRLLVTTYANAYPKLWEVADPSRPVAELPAVGARVAVFGANLVATLGADLTVWDVSDPARPVAATLVSREWTGMALRPDGKVLAAVAADGTGWLMDVADPREPKVLARFTAGPTTAVAFAPHGRTLVTAAGPTPRLWDVSEPRHPAEVATLSSDDGGPVTGIAFSPDGGSFVTSSEDGALHVWDAAVGRVERRVCAIAHPRITVDEWQRYLPGVPYGPICS